MVERSDELESDRIQQDIDRTRQRMSGTIDEIQERLSPSRILHDATNSVREASVDSVRTLLSHAGRTAGRTAGQARAASTVAADYARSHRLPTALALSGAALLLARVFAGRRRRTTGLNGVDLNGWDDPSAGTPRTRSSLTSWIAENPLAVGAAVAAAGTVVGISWANQKAQRQGTQTVTR